MATADTEADYHLVEESQERSFDCPVCLQVLNDPCTSECCRKNFCRACVIKIRGNNNPCPMCRHPEFKTRLNSTLSREVYQLQVYCGNQSKGCEWKGCLGEAETHLNKRPVTRYLTSGCQYVDIECMFCSKPYQRCQIGDHCDHRCPQRPFSCEYCNKYDSHYEDVSNNHWPVCHFYPVLCTNLCGERIPRKSLKRHIAKDCSMTVIECEFKQFGCEEKLPRKEMVLHIRYSGTAHKSLRMMSTLVTQMKKQEKEIHDLETKLLAKNKKQLKDQKAMVDKHMTNATDTISGMLINVQQKLTQLEFLEQKLNERITQDNGVNRNLISTRRQFEHRFECELLLKEARDARIWSELFIQNVTLSSRIENLENSLYQRLRRKFNELGDGTRMFLKLLICMIIILFIIIFYPIILILYSLRFVYCSFLQ